MRTRAAVKVGEVPSLDRDAIPLRVPRPEAGEEEEHGGVDMVVGERVGKGGDAAAQAVEHHGAQALTSQPASAVSTALSANSSCFE